MFYEIPHRSSASGALIDSVRNSSEHHWANYYSWIALPLSVEFVLGLDEFLRVLYFNHPFTPAVLRIDPYAYYTWHVDTERGVGLNMILNGGHSHCLFAHDYVDGKYVGLFSELIYKPNTFYLLDVQSYHSVINFENTRYMFSLEFEENKDSLSYSDLLREISGY